MNEAIIKEIVEKVFEKTKAECPVHSKNALSNYISDATALSSKTLERLYDKYIERKGTAKNQSEHTINELCQYLTFDSYTDYIQKNGRKKENSKSKGNWKFIAVVSLILGVGLILVLLYNENGGDCMVWKKDHFEKTDCSVSYKEKVVPLNLVRLANFKKVKVDLTTNFFNEANQEPLLWYHKSGTNEVEFFTAPGLHPVTGITLKAITPYIVQKYVPLHVFDSNSFTK